MLSPKIVLIEEAVGKQITCQMLEASNEERFKKHGKMQPVKIFGRGVQLFFQCGHRKLGLVNTHTELVSQLLVLQNIIFSGKW